MTSSSKTVDASAPLYSTYVQRRLDDVNEQKKKRAVKDFQALLIRAHTNPSTPNDGETLQTTSADAIGVILDLLDGDRGYWISKAQNQEYTIGKTEEINPESTKMNARQKFKWMTTLVKIAEAWKIEQKLLEYGVPPASKTGLKMLDEAYADVESMRPRNEGEANVVESSKGSVIYMLL